MNIRILDMIRSMASELRISLTKWPILLAALEFYLNNITTERNRLSPNQFFLSFTEK